MNVSSTLGRLFLLSAVLTLLTGCVEKTILIKINMDGSGVVRVRSLTHTAVYESMGAPAPKTFDRDQLVSTASRMGSGVRLARAKDISRQGREGYLAEFSFSDITKLRLAPLAQGDFMEPNTVPEYRFEFVPGPPASLTISPKWKNSESTGTMQIESVPPADTPDPVAREQRTRLEQTLGTIQLSCYLQLNGSVIESNATHRMEQTPSTITLFYLNMSELMDHNQRLQQVLYAKNSSEVSQLAKQEVPGLIVEDPNKQIMIRFQ